MTKSPNIAENIEAQKPRRFTLFTSLWISLLILAGLLVLTESLSRIASIQNRLAMRSVGNYHAQFEIKWFKLQDYVLENDGVDVILLGNSMVNTGIDPEVFAEEYQQVTGADLRVFNFGVEGLTVAPNSSLVQLLVETYQPKTLIYFTEMRDYVAMNGLKEEETFLSNDWLMYRLGKQNIKGWFIDRSTAIQMLLPFRGWTRSDFLDNYVLNLRRVKITQPNGYEPETRTRQDIDVRPDPSSPADKPFFELFQNFTIDPQRVSDLHTILSKQEFQTNVFVSEIPVYFTFYDYFGGETVHQDYLKEISKIVIDYGGFFVPPVDPDLIPLDGRADRLHLNIQGADIFSKLLAGKFSSMCLQEHKCLDFPLR
ncbi:MAG: hypothetical protein FD147_1035 [Chloroflexi bacterium]|nr:MAG: hypothetical protein FD147_1035 [Chloroflexota bacterium]